MTYKEVKDNLFDYHDKGYHLVHCISADFKLGAGIAKEFDRRYQLRDDLMYVLGPKWWQIYEERFPGEALLHSKKRVIDLVTKTRFWHKPTMYSMKRALTKMRDGCLKKDIDKIAMPKIGCGLDQLDWDKVSAMIKKIFADTEIDIVVCYL